MDGSKKASKATVVAVDRIGSTASTSNPAEPTTSRQPASSYRCWCRKKVSMAVCSVSAIPGPPHARFKRGDLSGDEWFERLIYAYDSIVRENEFFSQVFAQKGPLDHAAQ
jgi:hypothetical protein